MTTGRTKIGAKAEAAIAALLTEPTQAAAAAKAGISEATVSRWLKATEFKAAYRAARKALVEAAIGRVQGATGQAVEALVRNLTAGQPGAEIRAAVAILDHALKGVEVQDIAVKVDELERLLGEMKNCEHEQQQQDRQPAGQAAGGGEGAGEDADRGAEELPVPGSPG